MSEQKLFCGSGKEQTTKFGKMLKISFSKKDLDMLNSQLSNGWVNCVVKEKKDKVEGKPTHYLEIDLWKPKEGVAGTTVNPVVSGASDKDSGLPF